MRRRVVGTRYGDEHLIVERGVPKSIAAAVGGGIVAIVTMVLSIIRCLSEAG